MPWKRAHATPAARALPCRRPASAIRCASARFSSICCPTPSSSPSAAATLYAGAENGELVFRVADTGIGMSLDQIDKVFCALRAGRQFHHPQVWRHRPGPDDHPPDRRSDGRQPARRAGWAQHLPSAPACVPVDRLTPELAVAVGAEGESARVWPGCACWWPRTTR